MFDCIPRQLLDILFLTRSGCAGILRVLGRECDERRVLGYSKAYSS